MTTKSLAGGTLIQKDQDEMNNKEILVSVEHLKVHFAVQRGVFGRFGGLVRAVDDVSFEIYQGETLGLVGESGSGKSSAGRAILQLHRPTDGRVLFRGVDLTSLKGEELRQKRQEMQMIFQDPYASLNPRMTVGSIVGEPLDAHKTARGREKEKRIMDLLNLVGLGPSYTSRYPHELSGGQRQRVGIARSLALNPSLVVCDEPISSLDVSIQAQIVNLLNSLQRDLGLTYLFIAHDLSMVSHIADRVIVMYLGMIMEVANVDDLYDTPSHPYTKALLSAIPVPDPLIEEGRQRIILSGDPPSPRNPPVGCYFNTRCPVAEERCFQETPVLREVTPGHRAACHLI